MLSVPVPRETGGDIQRDSSFVSVNIFGGHQDRNNRGGLHQGGQREPRILTQQEIVKELIYDEPIPHYKYYGEKKKRKRRKSQFRESQESIVPLNLHRLEALHEERQSLIVLRRAENAISLDPEKRLQAFTQYDIVSSDGIQIYVAVEKTTERVVRWIRDARPFCVTLYDKEGKKVLTVERPLTMPFFCAQYYCLCCLWGFKGCGNQASVILEDGSRLLGYIQQEFSCKETNLRINNDIGNPILLVTGRLVDGIFDVFVYDDDGISEDPVAMIETLMTPKEVFAFYQVKVAPHEDPYGVTFLTIDLTPKYKAMIVAAVILMDFIFCKPSGDYPHWTELIPLDYKPEEQTSEKIFRDGSKEIIVTSVRPKDTRKNRLLSKRYCACCRWFFGFLCLFCPLGFVRNGLRCLNLIVCWIIGLILIVCLIMKYLL